MRLSSLLLVILAQYGFAIEYRSLWRQVTPPSSGSPFHSAGSLFITNDQLPLVSQNGTEWQVLPDFGRILDVAWSGEQWFLLTETTVLRATEPGVWNDAFVTFEPLGRMVWADDQLVVTSFDSFTDKTSFWTSSDGRDWVIDSEVEGRSLVFLVYFDDRLICFDSDGVRFEKDPEAGWLAGADLAPPLERLYSNGQILVGLSENQLTISEDGRSWRFLNVGDGAEINDLTFNGTQFTICGELGLIGSSTDGETWEITTVETVSPGSFTEVAVVGSRFLAKTRFSTYLGVDGVWQEPGPRGFFEEGLEIAGNLLVRSRDTLFTYSDGQWTTHDFEVSASPVIWQDRVVAQNSEGIIYLSSDGLSWDMIDTGLKVLGQLSAVDDTLMFISEKGIRHTSSDGRSWESLALPLRSGLYDISHGNGVYLARDEEGRLFRSTDSCEWSPIDRWTPFLVYGNGTFLTSAYPSVSISRNGLLWRQGLSPFSRPLFIERVVWTGSYFTAGGMVSEDGDGWHPLPQIHERANFAGHLENRWFATGGAVWLMDDSWEPAERPSLRAMVIPWVVSNDVWRSRVAFTNADSRTAMLELEAVPDEGDAVTTVLELAPDSVQSFDADALFPGMTRYALFIESDRREVYASFLTINTEARSGGHSPSQTTALDTEGLGNELAFGYTPGDQVSAIVLLGTYSRDHLVDVTLHSGTEILGRTQVMLTPRRPFAALVTDLFPDAPADAAISVQGTNCYQMLAGTSFVFNQEGQPSMAGSFRVEEGCQ